MVGAADIESWLATATTADDEDERGTAVAQYDGSRASWERVVEQARGRVLQSGTKARTEYVGEHLLALASRRGWCYEVVTTAG